MLGYENKAALYPCGEKQEFDFGRVSADSVRVRIAFLPSFPVNNRQIRLSVSLDGQPEQILSYETHWHSAEWCENVLTGQSIKEAVFPVGGQSSHTLVLKALDEGVVVDQIRLL